MRWLLLILLPGCVYVSRDEYRAYWDADGDGWPLDEDCAPDDAKVFPYAADPRGDGCDSDCGKEPDADLDDWPDAADCGADDATIHPCSAAEVDGDTIDSDCDGLDGMRVDACEGLDPDHPDAEPMECGP